MKRKRFFIIGIVVIVVVVWYAETVVAVDAPEVDFPGTWATGIYTSDGEDRTTTHSSTFVFIDRCDDDSRYFVISRSDHSWGDYFNYIGGGYVRDDNVLHIKTDFKNYEWIFTGNTYLPRFDVVLSATDPSRRVDGGGYYRTHDKLLEWPFNADPAGLEEERAYVFDYLGAWADNPAVDDTTDDSTFIGISKFGDTDYYLVIAVSNAKEAYNFVGGGVLQPDGSLQINTDNDQQLILHEGADDQYGAVLLWSHSDTPDETNMFIRIEDKFAHWPFLTPYRTTVRLRLREDATTASAIVTTMESGTQVTILERGSQETIDGMTAEWVRVRLVDGTQGWCFSGYLDAEVEEF